MHWVSLILIHWIGIYPRDSAIQLLNNWGQKSETCPNFLSFQIHIPWHDRGVELFDRSSGSLFCCSMFSITGLSRRARSTDGMIRPPACPSPFVLGCVLRFALGKNNACVQAIPVNEIHSFVKQTYYLTSEVNLPVILRVPPWSVTKVCVWIQSPFLTPSDVKR